MTGSGKAAIATRLTVEAATAAPAAAVPARKRRRLVVMGMCSVGGSVAATAAAGGDGTRLHREATGGLADQGRLQRSIGQPEIALRFDRLHDAADLLSRIGEQLEHADQHPVVAKLV